MRLGIYKRLDPGFSLCRNMRTQIFSDEYDMPMNCERDEADYRAIHYLIRLADNTPIGVARSNIIGENCYIQRFGFLPEYRNNENLVQGFSLILKDCQTRYPFMPIAVDAQQFQEDFYSGFGFKAEGDVFHYAGFSLRNMILSRSERNNPQNNHQNNQKGNNFAKEEKTSLTNGKAIVKTKATQTV